MLDKTRCECSPEAMRMYIINTGFVRKLMEHLPYSTGMHTLCAFAYKQSFAFIRSAFDVDLKVHSRNVIEVYNTLFVALTEHCTLTVPDIYTFYIQTANFAYTASCSQEEL